MRALCRSPATARYCIEFSDDSMAPAYKAGHLGYIDPDLLPRPGDDVYVELMNGMAIVRHFVCTEGSDIILVSYRPANATRLHRSKIRAMHCVVGSIRTTR